MTRPRGIGRLAIAGASAFWITNLLISLTPVAADYRSGLSIRYVPMLLEAALGGLLVATGVSWVLLRFPARIPGRTPMTKSLFLSLCAFIAVTALVEFPAKFLGSLPDPWRLFLISMTFNALRILALGLIIGLLADRPRRQ